MKRPVPLLATALALCIAAAASAQQHPSTQPAPVPPPPGIDDPGVQATAPPRAAHAPAPASSLPALPSMRDDAPMDANGNPPPTVDVHQRDGNTIEEYREAGQLIMVRITPKHGVPYTYYVDDHGKLKVPPGAPAVKPVYYTIFKWGAPPKPVDQGGDQQ